MIFLVGRHRRRH